jgi:hypothetical protein
MPVLGKAVILQSGQLNAHRHRRCDVAEHPHQ